MSKSKLQPCRSCQLKRDKLIRIFGDSIIYVITTNNVQGFIVSPLQFIQGRQFFWAYKLLSKTLQRDDVTFWVTRLYANLRRIQENLEEEKDGNKFSKYGNFVTNAKTLR